MSITLQSFIKKYDGKFVETAGSPNAVNQCTDLVNAYIRDVLGLPIIEWTNARDFDSKLPQLTWIPNTPTGVPKAGDIVIWKHNQYGHIGVFIEGDIKSFRSFDQNYPTGTPAHTQNHSYTNPPVAGWLQVPTVVSETLKGIDISRHQGDINFDQVKSQVYFVIAKATEGTGFTDPKFTRNKDEARRVGLLFGAYHFARPDLNNTAIEEADWFLSVYKPLPGELLVLDYEPQWGGDAVGWCKSFLNRVSSKLDGHKALIYLNRSQTTAFNWSPVINAGYGLWIASYDNNPSNIPNVNWSPIVMKQYTSSGSVTGISGNVDMNTFFGSKETYKKYGYKGDSMLTQNELDACMVDREKFWKERDAALARVKELETALAQKPTEIIKEVVVVKEVPVEVIKEVIVEKPNDTLPALQLVTLALKAMLVGRW
jgi:GH25 family lysozyme M1 (1,4-beta-N-acetylmuramidase)